MATNHQKNQNIIILGAGPAGIFCGYELKKNGVTPLILEKESFPGGLAATHHLGKASFEVGPHIFHTEDEYILNIVKEKLGEALLKKDWYVEQYLDQKLLSFPNGLMDMIVKLGPVKVFSFIVSYLFSQSIKGNDLKSFIYRKVGKRLAHFNVINYTEKMWGLPIEELEVDWIKPRMDRISIWKILMTLFSSHKRSFWYPRKGAGQLYEIMANELDVHYQEAPISMVVKENKITQLITHQASYPVDQLVTSIPIPSLLELIAQTAPSEVHNALKLLRYRSQVYVAIHCKDENPLKSQWIYFPQEDKPFCRVHSAESFSHHHVEKGTSVYVFEYFCEFGDKIWATKEEELLDLTILHFSDLKYIPKNTIIKSKVLRKKYAYPLMDKHRSTHLNTINKYLRSIKNLHPIGRHGLFTYDNQHDAARTGVDAAQLILHKLHKKDEASL